LVLNRSVQRASFRAPSKEWAGKKKKKTKLLVTETDEPVLHNFGGKMGFFRGYSKTFDFGLRRFVK
jgi:hypothetical protein